MRYPIYFGPSAPPEGCARGSRDAIEPESLADSACLILDGPVDTATEVLATIRQHAAPDVYLRPVVRIGNPEDSLTAAVDHKLAPETVSRVLVEGLAERFHRVNEWVAGLTDSSAAVDVDPAFRILRFIASRGIEVAPVMTADTPEGFIYPNLTPLLDTFRDSPSMLDILGFLNTQQLIRGRFVTRCHFCSHCLCAFLNFKETCPDCGSEDIEADELLHHFRCGHVGAHDDYTTSDGLVCPKCERPLRQIGVDYDKPSVVFQCKDCRHRFQSPTVLSTCFRCGRSQEPEHQLQRRIMTWEPTAMGNSAALYGMDQLFTRVLDTHLDLWEFDALKRFIQVEAARIRRYGLSESAVIVLHFTNLSDLYVQLGQQVARVFGELAQLLKSVLRQSDLIAARGESTFILVLTETMAYQAERIIERIEQGIAELMEGNLDFKPALRSKAWKLTSDLDVNRALESLIEDHD